MYFNRTFHRVSAQIPRWLFCALQMNSIARIGCELLKDNLNVSVVIQTVQK